MRQCSGMNRVSTATSYSPINSRAFIEKYAQNPYDDINNTADFSAVFCALRTCKILRLMNYIVVAESEGQGSTKGWGS